MRPFSWVVVIAIVLGGGGTVRADLFDDISIRGSEELVIQRGTESARGANPLITSQEYKEVLESRFYLSAGWKNWSAGLRFDVLEPYFYEYQFGDLADEPISYTGIRKRYVEYEDGTNHVRVGSFSTLFGRGLALNLYQDPLINVDRELDGVLLERRGDRYSVTALAGRGAYLGFGDDLEEPDDVVGVYATGRPTDGMELGVGYVDSWDGTAPSAAWRNTKALGTMAWDGAVSTFDLSLYAEMALNWADPPDPAEADEYGYPGTGIYAELQGFHGPWSIRGEYKYYDLREGYYTNRSSGDGAPWSEPPSLRPLHDLVTLNRKQILVNKSNRVGVAGELSYGFDSGAALTANYVFTSKRLFYPSGDTTEVRWPTRSDETPAGQTPSEPFREIGLKSEVTFPRDWHTTVILNHAVDGTGLGKEEATLGLITEFELNETEGLAFQFESQRINNHQFEKNYERFYDVLEIDGPVTPPPFWDMVWGATYTRSPSLAIFVNYERSNEAEQWEKVSNVGLGDEPLEGSYFLFGVEFDIGSMTRIGLQGGSERGGVVCRGGTCRYIPPFKGVRTEFTRRF